MRCFSLELRSAGGEPNSTTASISDKQHRCIAGSRGNRRQNLIDSEVSIGIEGYWIRAVGCGRFGVAAEQSGENACSSVGPDTISGGKKKAASLDPDSPLGVHIRAEVRDSPRPGRIDSPYYVKGGNSIRGNTGNRNDPDGAPEFQGTLTAGSAAVGLSTM